MTQMAVSELVEQEHELWEAVKANDQDFFRRVLTEDFKGVFDTGVFSKQQAVDMMAQSEAGGLREYQMTDPAVLELTEDAVLLSYRANFMEEHGGQTVPYDAYITTAYVRRHGQWQIALHQQTLVGEPKQ